MEILADPISVNCRKVLAGLKLIGADYTLTLKYPHELREEV